jgi:GNAT superfamily N-acetyltransferase
MANIDFLYRISTFEHAVPEAKNDQGVKVKTNMGETLQKEEPICVFDLQPLEYLGEPLLDELVHLVNEANRARIRVFPGDRTSRAGLASYSNCFALRAIRESRSIGLVLLESREMRLHLSLLAVAPAWQGKGIGSALLARAERYALSLGLEAVSLDVVNRDALVNYYLSLGFVELSRQQMPIGHWGALDAFELLSMSKAAPSQPTESTDTL